MAVKESTPSNPAIRSDSLLLLDLRNELSQLRTAVQLAEVAFDNFEDSRGEGGGADWERLNIASFAMTSAREMADALHERWK